MNRFFLFLVGIGLGFLNNAGADVLENCYQAKHANFFTNDLFEIMAEKETPVLLLNEKKEVVGVLSVSPQYSAQGGKVTAVSINKLSLCSQLETEDFYYTEEEAEDLLQWTKVPNLEITQDEGLIKLSVKVDKINGYSTLLKVDFKAYDVFTDSEEVDDKTKENPDYIQDWGLPKGKGTFYLYIPKAWQIN